MTRFHLHLVSDATGETVRSVARACLAQFEEVEPVEHIWSMIRSRTQLDRAVAGIEANPGVVLFTLVDSALRDALQAACAKLLVPAIPVLDPVIGALVTHLGRPSRGQPGRQHVMDTEYFARMAAIAFALNHDDGQSMAGLNDADVILVGVSRTSKTPTCLYLANRGVKAANVPIVPNMTLPPELLTAQQPLIVGLTHEPERLIQVRKYRLLMLNQDEETEYTNPELVRSELMQARRLFAEKQWPVIDVTRRSIEETAAGIFQLLTRRRGESGAGKGEIGRGEMK